MVKLAPPKAVFNFLIFQIFGFFLYANVLAGEFISDDYLVIVNNPAIRHWQDLMALGQAFNTRLLTGLTFALNYALDGFHVWGYHAVNIVIHGIAAFFVYRFILILWQTHYLQRHPTAFPAEKVAFLAAFIFLSHPIQTESVAFITQRATSLATVFYLATLIFYLKARLSNANKWFILAFGSMLLALLSKEMTITIPIALVVLEFFFLREKNTFSWRQLKMAVPFFLALIVLPALLFLDTLGPSLLGLKYQVQGQAFDGRYFLTEMNVLATYLRLLFIPLHQNHDYAYPIVENFVDPQTIFSCLLLIALAWTAVKLFNRQRLISFCIVWFFLATSVEAIVVSFVHRNVIYEHWLYLPMVGFSLFLAVTLLSVISLPKRQRAAIGLALLTYSLLTVNRNVVWQTEIGFWQDVVKKSPNKSTPYFALGKAYQRQGRDDRAAIAYQQSLFIDPDYVDAYNNLGIIASQGGDQEQAIRYFEKALSLDASNANAYNNLAYVYSQMGENNAGTSRSGNN
jgi:tetratricopeptide (TPR) repeat protein